MTVLLNIYRSIFKNKTSLFTICLLALLSSFMFVYLFAGVKEVDISYDQMQETQNGDYFLIPELSEESIQQIILDYNISQEDMQLSVESLVEKYDIDLEKYYLSEISYLLENYNIDYSLYNYKIVVDGDITYFITDYNGKVNKTILEDESYYEHTLSNNEFYSTSDTSEYKGENLTRAYSNNFINLFHPIYSLTPFTKNNEGIIVSSETFEKTEGRAFATLLIDIKDDSQLGNFENDVNDMIEYNSFIKTTSIQNTVESDIALNYTLAITGFGMLIFITCVILIITFKNIMDNIKSELGILKLLCVSDKSIILSFFLVYNAIFIIGIAAGTAIGITQYNMMKIQFSNLYNIHYTEQINTWSSIILFVILFLIFLNLVLFIMLRLTLKEKILNLLHNVSKSISGKLLMISKKYTKFLPIMYRVKTSYTLKKISRVTIIILGVSLSFMFLSVSIGLFKYQSKAVNELNSSYNFNEIVYLEDNYSDDNINNFYSNAATLVIDSNSEELSLIGLNLDGNAIDDQIYKEIEEGIVIPKQIANYYDIKVGDEINIVIGKNKYDETVSWINSNGFDSNIYINVKDAMKYIDSQEVQYNGIYLQDSNEVNVDVDYAKSVDNLKDQNLYSFSQIFVIVAVTGVASIVLSILIFILISSLTFQDIIKDLKTLKLFSIKTLKGLRMAYFTFFILIVIVMIFSAMLSRFIYNAFEMLLNMTPSRFYIGINVSLFDISLLFMIMIALYYSIFTIVYVVKRKYIR